ncbi:hypothetical protein AB0D46_16065 [Streptomyces sp. NPDC048383]|uniref:hypothetical protein n=1 Tax=Streptomyces sp. NPDC048383 TaxID=3155386 RepID=UPI00341D248D
MASEPACPVTGLPSTPVIRMGVGSIRSTATSAVPSLTVPFASASRAEHSAFVPVKLSNGKTTGRSAGIEQRRSALPPKVPARNQASVGWFCAQKLPSGSVTGLESSGLEAAQLHHRLWSSPVLSSAMPGCG